MAPANFCFPIPPVLQSERVELVPFDVGFKRPSPDLIIDFVCQDFCSYKATSDSLLG